MHDGRAIAELRGGLRQAAVESRFQKGRSGNPQGRPRGTKKLVDLLGEALSQRSGLPNPDGSWMTQAEVIFNGLVAQAAGADLRAKRLLFDALVKLQQANICSPAHYLPQIRLDDSDDDAHAEVAADIDRLAAAMQRDAAARGCRSGQLPAPGPGEPEPSGEPEPETFC